MSYMRPQEIALFGSPQAAISYTNKGFDRTAPGVGGYLRLMGRDRKIVDNNGGFGGGGSGSSDGGAGGGGGFSGGGGGAANGWGGGGGSVNNGDIPRTTTFQKGRGSVTITFTGQVKHERKRQIACCMATMIMIYWCRSCITQLYPQWRIQGRQFGATAPHKPL